MPDREMWADYSADFVLEDGKRGVHYTLGLMTGRKLQKHVY